MRTSTLIRDWSFIGFSSFVREETKDKGRPTLRLIADDDIVGENLVFPGTPTFVGDGLVILSS